LGGFNDIAKRRKFMSRAAALFWFGSAGGLA
jgi:hypothetical protein